MHAVVILKTAGTSTRGWHQGMPMLQHQGSAWHQPPPTCVTGGMVEPSLPLHTSSVSNSLHCFKLPWFIHLLWQS